MSAKEPAGQLPQEEAAWTEVWPMGHWVQVALPTAGGGIQVCISPTPVRLPRLAP